MVMPVSPKQVVAVAVAAPVLVLSGCTPNEPPATAPGTTPPVWTGSPEPAPSGEAAAGGEGAEKLTAELKLANGTPVAEATFAVTGDYVTVTVQTTTSGLLTPGFHALHVHQVGKCEPNSVAPSGGAPGDFNSAGGHLHSPGMAHPAKGDLSPLQVRRDGSAMLVTTTDAFTAQDLTGGQGAALMIHEKADNFANIPPEKYQQINGDPPPDQNTLDTGDAGKRIACGVISAG
ncbi:superoxide dismutase family protein [Mycobacterium sp. MYCO198283]|uniref:superoxide dismutase[Cu-Zn] n=1 Tax=Mycobacterium sp. MYCO198283 TaxID=2883505 RepID=UPI001E399ADA|nr:superoxide dismutase family protein [Mycobacterium sp. MYCO198283]MCG5432214.1 superoxide dismutase family protein [Mycobacterium sp. MYCO198283]